MRRLVPVILEVLCLVGVFFSKGPRLVDERENKVVTRPPYGHLVSGRARDLHEELTIVDLHADTLLWGRDLLRRSRYGHVDIPRLADGNVALQVFSLPTKITSSMALPRRCICGWKLLSFAGCRST